MSKKETLKFRGVETNLVIPNDSGSIVLIALLDFHGVEFYNKVKEYGALKPELIEWFDNYFL